MRAGDIINGDGGVLLEVLVRGEGRAPETNATTPARSNEFEGAYFVGCAALPQSCDKAGQWLLQHTRPTPLLSLAKAGVGYTSPTCWTNAVLTPTLSVSGALPL